MCHEGTKNTKAFNKWGCFVPFVSSWLDFASYAEGSECASVTSVAVPCFFL